MAVLLNLVKCLLQDVSDYDAMVVKSLALLNRQYSAYASLFQYAVQAQVSALINMIACHCWGGGGVTLIVSFSLCFEDMTWTFVVEIKMQH